MPSVLDNLQGSDQIPNQKYQPPTHVPTSFTWSAEWGGHICIAGSFDPPTPTWSPIEMPGNQVTLDLLPGKKYYYKFVIDGNWVTQPGQPTVRDESGNENHEIQVELPPPPPPPSEEEKEEVIVEKEVEEVNEEQHQEEVVVEDHNEEELKVVDNDHHKEHQHQDELVVEKDQQHEESIVDENQQHEESVVVEDQQHEEQVMTDEHQRKEEQVEHQHQEEQVITEKQVMTDEHLHQEEQIMADEHQHQHQEEQVIIEEQIMTDEHQHQEKQVMTDEHHHQEEQIVVDEHQHQVEQVIAEEQIIADEHQHQEEQVIADEHHHQEHQEEQIIVEEQIIADEHEHQHQEEQVMTDEHHHQEEQIVVDEHHQEEQVIAEEQIIADEHQHQEEHHHQEEQIVVDEHQHQEEQVIAEEQIIVDEHQHQEEQVVADEYHHQEHQEEQVIAEEQIIADEHQHQEEQVMADEHHHQEEQIVVDEHQHQEEQVIAEEQIMTDEHQHQKEQVEYHHQEESHHEEEDQHHHEDESTNVRIEEQHGDTVVSESTSEQIEETETKIISSEAIEEIIETKIINNETIGQNETFMSNGSTFPESSTILKETIIGSDDDKLSTEHVVNNIEETHDDSIATETNETLSTSQNDTEPTVNLSSGPAVTNENIEASYELTSEETTLDKDKEISIITTKEQTEDFAVESEVISPSTGEHTAKETVISSTSEAELSIDVTSAIDSEIKAESENVDDTHDLDPSKTIETGFEYEDDYNYGGDDENITTEKTEDLNEETLKEVILNNTWAKDESYSYDENSLSQWTESHKPNPLVWPENVHLQWSDVDKSEQVTGSRSDGTTIISEGIETSNKSEIEVEGNSEHTFKETFTTSNDESNLKEVQSNEIPSTTLSEKTIINQAESSLNNSFESTTVVESYMEHKTNESLDETGINTTVTTTEFREKVVVEQCEKPESSATADGTSEKSSVFEQHKHLSEEIVTSKTIDTSKATESLQENQSIPTGINVPRKIISISPNISSPGESTRNADLYTHNVNVATNMSRSSKESMNTKSKHKKPVVEISTSREILKRDTRLRQQHGDELDKLDINLIYLVTSLATTFTLGILSMLYRSVFGTKK